MTTVTEHYENHLAPVYLWMADGFDAAISCGESEISAVCPNLSNEPTAVDLGARVHRAPFRNPSVLDIFIIEMGCPLECFKNVPISWYL